MKKKTGKSYFNELWDGMETHLKAFIIGQDQEELHLFRVQVKKIRAFLTLFDAVSTKRPVSANFKAVRDIFKHAGEIRNAHINIELTLKYQITNAPFITSQYGIIENGVNEFKLLETKYLKALKKSRNDLERNFRQIDDEQIREFYAMALERVADSLNNLEFNEQLHKCRQQIKILLYNRKIVFEALENKININSSYLDKLQGSIGEWHDNLLACELFSLPDFNDRSAVTRLKRQNTRLRKIISGLAAGFGAKALN